MLSTKQQRIRRHKRVRAKIKGVAVCPRFCVFRSNQHIYAQLIDDDKGRALAQADDSKFATKTKIARANEVGKAIAEKAVKLKIEKVVFDRGGFKYHGRVKAVADAARVAGLKF